MDWRARRLLADRIDELTPYFVNQKKRRGAAVPKTRRKPGRRCWRGGSLEEGYDVQPVSEQSALF